MGNCLGSRAKDVGSVHTQDSKECITCHAPKTDEKPLYRCAKCHVLLYCSKACQDKDWPTHKQHCGKGKAADEKDEKKGAAAASFSSSLPKSDEKKDEKSHPGIATQKVYSLEISVSDALGVVKDGWGKDEFFVVVDVDGRKSKTPGVKVIENPVFNHKFSFVFTAIPKTLRVMVMEDEILKFDELKGAGQIDLGEAYFNVDEKESKKYDGRIPIKADSSATLGVKVVGHIIHQVIGYEQPSTSGVSSENLKWLVKLDLHAGVKLPSRDLLSRCDGFAEVKFGRARFRTAVVDNKTNPDWNYSINFWTTKDQVERLISIVVYDANLHGHKFVGSAFLDISTLVPGTVYDHRLVALHEHHIPKTDAELSALLEKKVVADLTMDEKLGVNGGVRISLKVLTKEQAEDGFFDKLLAAYDDNKDGKVSFEELLHLAACIGIKKDEKELRTMFDDADKDKSGEVDRKEFVALFNSKAFQDDELHSLYRSIMGADDPFTDLISRGLFRDTVQLYSEKLDEDVDNSGVQIKVQQRKTGVIVSESIPAYLKAAMRVAYRTTGGKGAFTSGAAAKLLKKATIEQGRKMDDPASKAKITAFVQQHQLNMDEVEKPIDEYASMNEFFYRRLKPGARIVSSPDDDSVLISPADCRLTVWSTLEQATKLWIKGEKFCVESLLDEWGKVDDRASMFVGGSLVIARLAPQDYHRWHYPVSGIPLPRYMIEGTYHTVNPIAIRRDVDVYSSNKRCICPIETKEFGLVVLIAVAATMVGSIRFDVDEKDAKAGERVKKFDPHGYFAFGGSTVLLLFRPGSVVFDADLTTNSNQQLETLIQVGDKIGVAVGR